jgi:hypothetical protein
VNVNAIDLGVEANSVCYLTGFGGNHTPMVPTYGNGEEALVSMIRGSETHWFLDSIAWDMGQPTFGAAACVTFQNLPFMKTTYTGSISPTPNNQDTTMYPTTFGDVGSIYPIPIVYSTGADAQSYPSPRLANLNDAFCILNDIRGGFLGARDSAAIQEIGTTGQQQLTVTAGDGGGATAFATCIYYNQVNPPDPFTEPNQ